MEMKNSPLIFQNHNKLLNNNIKNMAVLKLLRNQTLYKTHEEALNAINAKAQELGDGELWIATYGAAPNAKSILALKRTDGLTVFDNDASSATITAAINALDATVGSTTVENGKHVAVQVVETDGKLTSLIINEKDIASAALLGTTADTASNQTAFGYIAKEAAARTAAIQALDKADTPVAKNFVTGVSETDGIISVKRGAVTSTDKTITLTDGADGGINLAVNVDGTTIVKNDTNGTLSVASSALTQYVGDKAINVSDVVEGNQKTISLVIPNGEKVLSQDATGLKTTIVLKSVTPSSTNIREEYELQGIGGEKLGEDTIKVYKDSAYKEIYLGTANDIIDTKTGTITKEDGDKQSLNYAYMKADGTYDLVKVDVSAFISENEAGNGVQIIEHKVAIKLADDNESFLTVDSNGLKLSGVATAITNAINGLDVDAQTKSDAAGFVSTTISETDGKVSNDSVSVTYGNYDTVNQKNGIAKTLDTKTYVDTVVANKNVSAEGDTYVKATASNNKVTVKTQIGQLLIMTPVGDGSSTLAGTSNNLMDCGDAAVTLTNFVNARLQEEIAKLDAEVTSNNGTNVQVKVTEVDGKITAVNIASDTTASASALDAEIAARKAVDGQTGQTYVAKADANYISKATSLNDADVKLDAALKTADNAMLTGVTGSNAITVSEKAAKNQTISLKLDETTKPTGFTKGDNVLSITSEGLYLSSIIDCGTY